jgi:methionyl-tRNA synthetase
VAECLKNFRFRDALSAIMKLSAWGNRFLQQQEPWKTFKTQPEKTAYALYETTQVAALLGYLCEPFMPGASQRILTMLGINDTDWLWPHLYREELVASGTPLGPAAILFRKVEDTEIQAQIEKLSKLQTPSNADTNIPAKAPHPEMAPSLKISMDDFKKVRLVVARIVEAEKVPKADKLLKLTLDIGSGERTVLSGIALHYTPDQVKGRQVVLLENLEPRIMRGIESQGMILMADGPEGKPVFLEPAEEVKPGSLIR